MMPQIYVLHGNCVNLHKVYVVPGKIKMPAVALMKMFARHTVILFDHK